MKRLDDQHHYNEFDHVFKSYRSIKVDDSEKQEMLSNIMNGTDHYKKKKKKFTLINPIISTVSAALIMLVGGYIFFNQILINDPGSHLGNNIENSEVEIIMNKINSELGIKPFIPFHEDYPIGTVTIGHGLDIEGGDNNGEVANAEVHYLHSLNEVVDEETKMIWEESERKEIIYGDLYMDDTAISMNITAEEIGDINNADKIVIDGKEIQYLIVEGSFYESVIAGIEFDDYGYVIQYYLQNDETEDTVKSFLKAIIKNAQ